jgi:hypothetical protein
VYAGQKIHVQAPSGALNEIVVPEGFGPGSTFTVEFADTPSNDYPTTYPTPPKQQLQQPCTSLSNYPTAAASPIRNDINHNNTATPDNDDGFATGFRNPDFVPGSRVVTAPAFASVYGNDSNSDTYNSYTMAQSDAKPLYSSAY